MFDAINNVTGTISNRLSQIIPNLSQKGDSPASKISPDKNSFKNYPPRSGMKMKKSWDFSEIDNLDMSSDQI